MFLFSLIVWIALPIIWLLLLFLLSARLYLFIYISFSLTFDYYLFQYVCVCLTLRTIAIDCRQCCCVPYAICIVCLFAARLLLLYFLFCVITKSTGSICIVLIWCVCLCVCIAAAGKALFVIVQISFASDLRISGINIENISIQIVNSEFKYTTEMAKWRVICIYSL